MAVASSSSPDATSTTMKPSNTVQNIHLKKSGLFTPAIAEEVIITNLFKNPSFERDNEGWSSEQGGFSYDTTEKLSGVRSVKLAAMPSGTRLIRTNWTFNPIVGHKYYGREYIKTSGDPSPADCRFEIFGGDGDGKNWVFAYNNGNHPGWTCNSGTVTINKLATSNYYIRSFMVQPKADLWIDGVVLIDLTAAFGEGSEPSKEWCDTYIPIFEGTINLKMPRTEIFGKKIFTPLIVEDPSLTIPMRIKKDRIIVPHLYEEFVFNNLVLDGDFSQGGWPSANLDTTHVKYGSKSLKISATASIPEKYIRSNFSIKLQNDHIYYARYEVYQETNNPAQRCAIYWPEAEPGFYPQQIPTTPGAWHIMSWVMDRTSFTNGSYPIRIDFDNNCTDGTMWADGFMMVDITEAFGKGLEPTKEWLDAHMTFYNGVV